MEEELKKLQEEVKRLERVVNNWNLFFVNRLLEVYAHSTYPEKDGENWDHLVVELLDRVKWLERRNGANEHGTTG